jgi:hypothetical protein
VSPFHWEIEFPEVFDRENPGFDAVVGNPPFLGGLRVSNILGMEMFAYLTTAYPGARHLCDLVAYFFRRGFDLLRNGGALGFVATNSIAQGDTRSGGLGRICNNGGEIYSAIRRLRWPGQAAVIVSRIHISKGISVNQRTLDGKSVPLITAYLFTSGGHDDPARLAGMNELFSQGTNIRSPGFLVGDNEEPTSTAEMATLLDKAPSSRSRVLPYLGGEEINSHPEQEPHRFVVYLSDLRNEEELAEWPELTEIVRQKVKPERDALGPNPNNIPLKRRWWAYHADRLSFYRNSERVLVASQVSAHLSFTFQPTNRVFGNTLNLFRLPSYSGFVILQSRIHEVWARFFASSMKDDMRYTPSDCFETFPFPRNFDSHVVLEQAGREYYEFRAGLMVRNNEGLTKTYNRFHDPDERQPDILRLRELHAALDAAVIDAYGWNDIQPSCEFLLDYEEEEDADAAAPRRRRKPWRYRWPDEIRDEVLARLLALNARRAAEEQPAGQASDSEPKAKAGARKKGRKKAGSEAQEVMEF